MVRLACISLPKIDLQIVALRHLDWKELPAVVVTEEKPLGRVTAANKRAYAAGVQPGMRYASALSICPELRAGVVVAEERDALRDSLVELLREFTPSIEPARDDHALFWVNASGLERIYGSPEQWAQRIRQTIESRHLVCSIAVGFTRFGTYAAAKVKRQITLFSSQEEEEQAALRAPLGVLAFDHEVLLRLHHLAIHTVRDFVRFSPGALRRRFGAEVEAIQRFARGEAQLPIQAVDDRRLLRREMRLLYPQSDLDALLHHELSLLRELVSQAWSEQQLVSEIVLEFCPEEWPGSREACVREEVRTARPTVDQRKLERLVRLRLEHLTLPGSIVRLAVEITVLPTERAQDDLFAAPLRRDPGKALSALSEVAAELGNDAVRVAHMEDAHLPESQYRWQRIERLVPPRPATHSAPPDPEDSAPASQLVRRILHAPLPLSRIPDEFSYPRMVGPYELSGGWWTTERQSGAQPADSAGRNLHEGNGTSESGAQSADSVGIEYRPAYRREYYYLQDRAGRMLWVYYDGASWRIQGVVE